VHADEVHQPLPRKVSEVQLTLSSTRAVGPAEVAGFQRWEMTARVPDAGGDGSRVGGVSVLEVDLLTCDDPWGALDGSNEDIAHMGGAVFDEMTGQLSEALESRLGRSGSRVLVLDRVELEPAWQGHNVAALLVAETLEWMRLGTRVAVCLPAPLHRGDASPEQYDESIRRMQQVWSQVGFQPFRDGVWLLEPGRGPLGEKLSTLRGIHGLR
jgi:GNAT superfamily N-acetyltransferase